MELPILVLVVTFLPWLSHSAVVLKPISNIYLPYAYEADGITGLYGIDKDAVEQSAYDFVNGLVYAAGSSYIHIVDYNNLTNPFILDKIVTKPTTDVEQCGSRVAFAVEGETPAQPGQVHVYDLCDRATGRFEMAYTPLTVGFGPDMLHFTKDCSTIVVANEGTPYETPSDVIDPEGSVSIIRFQETSLPIVTTVDFRSFNDRADEYVSKGVRWHYRGEISQTPTNFSQSLEPEYVTFNTDDTKAYITLQENNAIAEVNLITESIDEIYTAGVKSWKDIVLDGSDTDSGIDMQSYDISSFNQPDGLKFIEFKGSGYIITANEGDTLELNAGGQTWSDAKRGRQLVTDGQVSPVVGENLQAALADDSRLGRLEFSSIDGINTTDPLSKISHLHFFGGRGISIFRANDLSLLWDSGDFVETIHAVKYPRTFNGNTKPDDPFTETPADFMDNRSDDQGPECESMEIGELDDGTQLVFVGVDRSASILIFSFNGESADPQLKFESILRDGGTNQTFNVLLEKRNLGNLDPEDLRFIPAGYSSTGTPLLLVTSSVSGSLAMYEVVNEGLPMTTPSAGYWVHTTNYMALALGLITGFILTIER